MTTKALAPDVSTWPAEDPQLIGSRCDDCSATTWPRQPRCPRCSGANISELLLPRRGTLVAWTTQGFVPKQPYAATKPPRPSRRSSSAWSSSATSCASRRG